MLLFSDRSRLNGLDMMIDSWFLAIVIIQLTLFILEMEVNCKLEPTDPDYIPLGIVTVLYFIVWAIFE